MIPGIVAQQAMILEPAAASGIQFVGRKTIGSGTTSAVSWDFTGLSDGIDSSPAVGDLFILIACVSGFAPTVTLGSLAGLTGEIFSRRQDSVTGRDGRMTVWRGVYEAGSASGSTFDIGSDDDIIFTILVFRNASYGGLSWSSGTTANSNPPDVTPNTAGDWVVAAAFAAHQKGSRTLGIPSGPAYQYSDQRSWNGGYDLSVSVAIKEDPAIGSPFDPGSFPLSTSSTSSDSAHVDFAMIISAN